MDNSVDKQSNEDPHGFVPGYTTPAEEAEKKQTIGEQPESQAEKLLSKPILIPRNPWALMTRIAAVVSLTDMLAVLIVVLIFAALGQSSSPRTALVLIALLLILKTFLLVGFIIKVSVDWVPDSYQIDERQLIKQNGVTSKEDKVYELANIRHVDVQQSFIGRQLEYGNIELLVATAGLNETIKLTDVKDPRHFEEVFKQYLG